MKINFKKALLGSQVEPIEVFARFMECPDTPDMFLTGQAGTGKTTMTLDFVEYLKSQRIPYIMVAHTHKACEVLESKLPPDSDICTLDSYLKRRPGINEHATKHKHVEISVKAGDSDAVPVILVDEFSMVGDEQYTDLTDLQFDEDGNLIAKILYIGDPYQLPPVGDTQAVIPCGNFWIHLDIVRRTDKPDILNAMSSIVNILANNAEPQPIVTSENITRNCDIVEKFLQSEAESKVCLAWTNLAVQNLNIAIAGKELPEIGDKVFNSTLRVTGTVVETPPSYAINEIRTPIGILKRNTKYKTLEYLLECDFIDWISLDVDGSLVTFASVFGHANFNQLKKDLTSEAVSINAEIEDEFNMKPADWARANNGHKLAARRSRAWRQLLAYKSSVCCIDFPFAMTTHKAQGSTYDEVYLDVEDLYKCQDAEMYYRSFYVMLSRASQHIYTN